MNYNLGRILAAALIVPLATFPLAAQPGEARAAGELAVSIEWAGGAVWHESQIVDADFDMVGLTWDDTAGVDLELRMMSDGMWSQWSHVHVDTHGNPTRPGTDLLFVGMHDALQVRASHPVDDATVQLFNTDVQVSESPTIELSAPAVDTDGDYDGNGSIYPDDYSQWPGPSFVRDREDWDTDNCRPEGIDLAYSQPRAIAVHHTDSSNNYSRASVPTILRNLCNYAVNWRGLDDLHYNFVVDRYGDIWEGRLDSKTSPIQGAHIGGFNSHLQGVVMLGDNGEMTPPAAQVNATRQIVDWLTGWYSINPSASVNLEAGRTAGTTTAYYYEEGDIAQVPGVLGHRELGATSCPGTHFWPSFSQFRASIQPTDFGVTAADLTCNGQPATIVGTPGHDVLYGTEEADVIVGLGGDDVIYGLGGSDIICGGPGNDVITGGD